MHQLVARFERLIAAALTHPAIVAPLATGIEGVAAYLAQEYIVAESLDIAVRERGPARPADALRVAAQLAGALDLAALVQIDHGVLHPRDILLSADEARLTGLGIARALDDIGVPAPVRRPYAAPERLAGSRWDRRADVFGLAALIHELLWTRRLAAAGQEAADSLTEIAGGDLARLRAVFGRALAEDPGNRFDTALEFVGALEDAFPDVVVSRQQSPVPSLRSPVSSPQSSVASRQQSALRNVRLDPNRVRIRPGPQARLKTDITYERRSTEPEPRLPLDGPGAEREPALAEMTAEPSVAQSDLDLRRAESDRYAEVESVPAAAPLVPAGLMNSYQPPSGRTLAAGESRSSISPLAFALTIGAALGFAAGYGVGARDRSAAPSQARASTAPAPVASPEAAAATTGAVREFTEGAVTEPPKPQSDATTGADVQLKADATPVPADTGRPREEGRSLRLQADGLKPTDRGVRLQPDQRGRLGSSAAPLTVLSRPDGAKVFIDGRLVGSTPLVLAGVVAGEHALRLDRDGYRSWSSSIRVVTSERNRVTASLEH